MPGEVLITLIVEIFEPRVERSGHDAISLVPVIQLADGMDYHAM